MDNECKSCFVRMKATCKKRNYNSEECKKLRDKYDKEMKEYLETHCIHCGRRKDIPDSWDVVKEIWKDIRNEIYWLKRGMNKPDPVKSYERLADKIIYKLQQAGIEEE